MSILSYAGTALAVATVPLLATLVIFTKLVAFIPLLVKWKKDEEMSTAKGVWVPQDEGKVAEFNGKFWSKRFQDVLNIYFRTSSPSWFTCLNQRGGDADRSAIHTQAF